MKKAIILAWIKGFNETTNAPLPPPSVIDISLAPIENEPEAYYAGVEFARMWIEGDEIEGSNLHD